MSISPSLQASARSAYRQLFRASSTTFRGDESILRAFRLKMRTDALETLFVTDPRLYEEKVRQAVEVARFLRQNVVQGEKIQGQSEGADTEMWRLRVTQDTELGLNESIKCPPTPVLTDRRARRKEKAAQGPTELAAHDASTPSSTAPRNYSALKKAHKQRQVPQLNEEDLEETFVRGSGPGGQSVNKTENNVQLIHRPTGIRVTCHTTRSLSTNRMLARRRLIEKLDQMQNPGLSKGELRDAKERERERRRRKKAKKRARE